MAGSLALLSVTVGLSASADPIEQDGEGRWVPSLDINSGVSVSKWQARVNATDSADEFVRPPVSGTDVHVSPFVGVGLRLMTPAISIPGRPRVYVSGEILPHFAASRDVAKEGDPTGIRGPILPPPVGSEPVPRRTYTEEALLGVGSRATSQLDTMVYGAGLGVSFPLDWNGRQLRLKTSFEWTYFEIDYEGVVLDGQCLPAGITTRCTPSWASFPPPGSIRPGFTREVELSASDSIGYNGIGPGFELEMETGRVGALAHSLFFGARAYYILGDRTLTLRDEESYDDPLGTDTVKAEWDYKIQPWMFRAIVGMRFHWIGK